MKAWLLVVVLVMPACDRVFGSATCWDPTQLDHDEDQDGVADGCDLCPGAVDPDQRDDDGDGVGDACDPHRGEPRDRLVWFDGFNRATLDPLWQSLGGDWSFGVDEIQQLESAAGFASLVYGREFSNATIEAVVDHGIGGGGPNQVGAGARMGFFNNEARGVVCAIVRDQAAAVALVVSNPSNTANRGTAPFDDDTSNRILVSATGECRGTAADGPSATARLTNAPIDGAAGDVGVFTGVTSATFKAVTVIESD